MKNKDLHKKQWTDRGKTEKMWISVGFGKAQLNITTEDGFCYVCKLKELDIRLARIGKKEASEDADERGVRG